MGKNWAKKEKPGNGTDQSLDISCPYASHTWASHQESFLDREETDAFQSSIPETKIHFYTPALETFIYFRRH